MVGNGSNDFVDRNIISANGISSPVTSADGGIRLDGASHNVVAGNYIGTDASGTKGTDASGTKPLGNSIFGVLVNGSASNQIGGNSPGDLTDGNVISANAYDGVAIGNGSFNNNTLYGNDIGTDVTGTANLGNGHNGVLAVFGTQGLLVGGNDIAFNGQYGVAVTQDQTGLYFGSPFPSAPTYGVQIEGNSIHNNKALGIGLGGVFNVGSSDPGCFALVTPLNGVLPNDSQGHSGANRYQNFPIVTSAVSSSTDTSIAGTFSETAEPNTTITLDFYADPSGYGQGQTWLGSTTVMTDANGNVAFTADLATGNLAGQRITATATDASGDTSEFALDVQATTAANQTYAQYLQAALPQSATTANSMTIQASASVTPATVIAAVNGLTNVTQPVTIILDLRGGTYSCNGVTIDPPSTINFVVQNGTLTGGPAISGGNVTLNKATVTGGLTVNNVNVTINSSTVTGGLTINGGNVTMNNDILDPDYSALTVAGGQVVVINCFLETSGNAPTVLVTGGNATLRETSISQNSTVYSDPAIEVTGGTINLGTATIPGGNAVDVNNSGGWVINTSGNAISIVGDTFYVGSMALSPAPLSLTTLASSSATSTPGKLVTFTVTVAPNPPGSATPTGSVVFKDTTTNTILGTAMLSGGSATLSTSALALGLQIIQASYSGDGSFLPSASTISVNVTFPFLGFQAPKSISNSVTNNGMQPPVTVADLRRNSTIPDLIVANQSNDSVSVLLGNGDGTFQAAQTFATSATPLSVAVAHLTGDGNADLVVGTSNGVDVLLGNGDGTFQPEQTLDAGANATSVAVADLMGDGKAPDDLVVANTNAKGVDVLLGNGNGTFQPPKTFATGYGPESVAVADLTGDGKPPNDLVVANYNTHNVSVLLGNGDGTFQTARNYSTGGNPDFVTVADLTGDGKPPDDLLVVNYDNNVSLLLSNVNGTFQNAQTITPVTRAPQGYGPSVTLAAADLNGDGKPDLVLADPLYNRVNVLLGNGDGTFQSPLAFTTNGRPYNVAVADLNGDGAPDVVVGGDNPGTVDVLLGIPKPASATTLKSSDSKSVVGQQVTFTATVSSKVAGAGTPTGSVNFFDQTTNTNLGTVALTSGSASLQVSTLNVGNHTIVANYQNEGGFLNSNGSLNILVNDPPTAVHITQPTITSGGQVSFTSTAAGPTLSDEQAGYTYTINWGDGTVQNPDTTVIPASANNGSGVAVQPHTYAPGIYTLILTAAEQAGLCKSTTALVIVSATAGDSIALSGGPAAGQVAVTTTDEGSCTTTAAPDQVLAADSGGSDSYTVNFGSNLTTPITIAGDGATSGSSVDTLIVNGDGSSTNVINKAAGQITWGNPVTETVFRSGIANTTINANGTQTNYINDPGGSTTINGGPGANFITITATTGSGVVINGGPTSNTYTVDLGNVAGPVVIQNSNKGTTDKLIVIGAPSNNSITVTGNQVTAGTQTISDSAPLASLTLVGGSGTNTYTINTGSTVNIVAGTGDNILNINGGKVTGITTPSGVTTPIVFADSYTVMDNGKLSVSASAGVLANDLSTNGQPLTAVLATGPAHGSLTFNADGSFVYTPVANFVGFDTFTYQAKGSDSSLSALATVTIQVTYKFSGFLPPLKNSLVFAVNRTIPIQFQLSDYNGNAVTSLSAVTSLQIQALDANGKAVGALFNPTAAGNTGLSNSGGQYHFNWQTKGLTTGSYQIILTLADGTTQTKTIRLTAGGSSAGLVTDGSSGTATAGALLGGEVDLYVDNSNGDLTSDELARIQDAVTSIDATIAPYGVVINEVSDPTQANVTMNMNTTSSLGGVVQGVLGCTTDADQVTMIQGWNWYAGSDPSQIGSGQYDFETAVMHELVHVLGLGHSSSSTSVMCASLSAGTANRALVTTDLNVPDSDSGPCALHAAPAAPVSGTSNSHDVPALSSTSIPSSGSPNNGSPMSAADQLFATLSRIFSAAENAYQSELSSVVAMWQSADALALQRLDALVGLEAGAMGMSKDTLTRDFLFASLPAPNGV
jgi:hypothetical protein